MLTMISPHESQMQTFRDWVSQLMAQHGVATVSQFARRAGLAESTLTRFMNAEGPGNLMREGTIAKIENAFNARRPATRLPQGERQTPERQDASARASNLTSLMQSLRQHETPEHETFILSDRALDLAGYLPGDLIIVDTSQRPEIGDVVALRFRSGAARSSTVTLRIYDTPFLTAHSTDDTMRRPLMIEPERIEIIGIVTAAMRERHRA